MDGMAGRSYGANWGPPTGPGNWGPPMGPGNWGPPTGPANWAPPMGPPMGPGGRSGHAGSRFGQSEPDPNVAFFAFMGAWTFKSVEITNGACTECSKMAAAIQSSKNHIKKLILRRNLEFAYIQLCDRVLQKKVVYLNPQASTALTLCENCPVTFIERNQARLLFNITRRCYGSEQYVPPYDDTVKYPNWTLPALPRSPKLQIEAPNGHMTSEHGLGEPSLSTQSQTSTEGYIETITVSEEPEVPEFHALSKTATEVPKEPATADSEMDPTSRSSLNVDEESGTMEEDLVQNYARPFADDPPFLGKMGAFTLGGRDTHLDCANCQKQAEMIIKYKNHLQKVLRNVDLSEHYLNRCELVLTKNFLPGAGADCENCKTAENEKRQCSSIERMTEKTYKRDGTYVHADDNFDTYPDLVEGPFISRMSKDMERDKDSILKLQRHIATIESSNEELKAHLGEKEEQYKESILELQSHIATIQSSKEELNVQLGEKEDAVKTAEARTEKAKAQATQLRNSLVQQNELLAKAVKDAEAAAQSAEAQASQLRSSLDEKSELSVKAVKDAEARVENAEAQAKQLRSEFDEQRKLLAKALKNAESRVEKAESQAKQLQSEFDGQRELLAKAMRDAELRAEKAESQAKQLRSEHDQQKKLLAEAQAQTKTLQAEVDEQKKLLIKAENEVGRLGAEVNGQKKQLLEANHKSRMMQANLESVNKRQNRQIEDLHAQLGQLSETVKGLVAAGTPKPDTYSEGATHSEEAIVEAHESLDAVADAIGPDDEEEQPTIPTQRENKSGRRSSSTWMINFVSILAFLAFFQPIPVIFNVGSGFNYGNLVTQNTALNNTQCEWEYIPESPSLTLPLDSPPPPISSSSLPSPPTGPADPAPGDLPLTTTKLQKVVNYTKNKPYKVAGYTIVCFSLGVYYYLGPGVHGIYVHFA
ncbi:hypothetical protein F5882DRAFT_382233 [Hyaloscypha sp. PMI_1271]|nr:hypothetical protein F5882DRAFT_382233 [Hyaloscypha sp. PMI_1271]